jgi:hypothetical protein
MKNEKVKFEIGFVVHSKDCKAMSKNGKVKKKVVCTCGVLQIASDVQIALDSFHFDR